MNNPIHIPVLLNEIIEFLNIKKTDTVVDFTMGFGGHAKELIPKLNSSGRYIGIDQDINAINFCKEKFSKNKNVSIYHSNYSQFPSILKDYKPSKVSTSVKNNLVIYALLNF